MFSKKHKNDIILVAAVLFVAAAVFLYSIFMRSAGAEAVVTIGGGEAMRFSLLEDCEISLGEDGRNNTLVISGGTACITQASCPDHVCVNQGAIKYEGEIIVCLPNELIITIEGGEVSEFDGISG